MAHQSAHGKANRLINESSPYLKQHAYNPVDWYPWGNEAFEKAKAEDKPIFLSIGYSTCRWCHVMERESFENEEIAGLLNEVCVNVKVDREVLPDVDRVYMTYVQAVSGRGGWPMSVFLTPDTLTPIYGGTYYPPNVLKHLLGQIKEMWQTSRDKLIPPATLMQSLQASDEDDVPSSAPVDAAQVKENTLKMFERMYDTQYGGFGRQPKFPTESIFSFLHAEGSERALEMSGFTLQQMARGGIHDQLGLGFHRYSVDRIWHIPHFEIMLYDNAQLVVHYLTYYSLTGDKLSLTVARGILSYLNRTLLSPSLGAYMSAEDAESLPTPSSTLKEEGAFYAWTSSEIVALLGKDDAEVFSKHFGVKEEGNVAKEHDPHGELQGKNVLMEQGSVEETAREVRREVGDVEGVLERGRKLLFEEREKRPRPHLDDKIIASWNGLMLKALAYAALYLPEEESEKWYEQGAQVAEFIRTKMVEGNKLLRCYGTSVAGVAEDYACVINGLLALYQVHFDPTMLKFAIELQQKQDELFWDDQNGGYFASAADSDASRIMRLKDDHDGAEPSSNSTSLHNLFTLDAMAHATDPALLGLAHLPPEIAESYASNADALIRCFAAKLQSQPASMPEMVAGVLLRSREPRCVIIKSETAQEAAKFAKEVRGWRWRPDVVLVWERGEGKVGGRVCAGKVCGMPKESAEEVWKEVESVGGSA